MSLHTYKISLKPNDNVTTPAVYSLTDTGVIFSTNLTKSTQSGIRSSGRIDFISNNLSSTEVQALRALYAFVEQTISSYEPNIEVLIQLEELNTDSEYVILMPFSHLEAIHLHASNQNAGDYQTDLIVAFELFSSALREEVESVPE